MNNRGCLLRCDEAQQLRQTVEDDVTRNFLNMPFAHMVKARHFEDNESPISDFDMLYFVRVLTEFFSEHEVIARTLAGERVGQWFDDE